MKNVEEIQALFSQTNNFVPLVKLESDKTFNIGRFSSCQTFDITKIKNYSLTKEEVKPLVDISRRRTFRENNKPPAKTICWNLEDDDKQHSFIGKIEPSQTTNYVLLIKRENDFAVITQANWFEFKPKRHFKTLTTEEAEEEMKKRSSATQTKIDRFAMKMKREKEDKENSEAEDRAGGGGGDGSEDERFAAFGEFDSEDEGEKKKKVGKKKSRASDEEAEEGDGEEKGEKLQFEEPEEKGEDLDFNEVKSDDEVEVPEEEIPEEPPNPTNEDEEEEGEGDAEGEGQSSLTESGKELKNLLKNFEEKSLQPQPPQTNEQEEEDDLAEYAGDSDDDEEFNISNIVPQQQNPLSKKIPAVKEESTGGNSGSGSGGSGAKEPQTIPEVKTEGDKKRKKLPDGEDKEKRAKAKVEPNAAKPKKKAVKYEVDEKTICNVIENNQPLTIHELFQMISPKGKEEKEKFALIVKNVAVIQKKKDKNYLFLRK